MRVNQTKAAGLLLALLAFLPIACKDNKDESAADQGAARTATAPQRPDPAVLARQAADQVEALKSFHFVLEHENGGTPIALELIMNRAEGDLVKPDRLRADVEAKTPPSLGGANVKVKVVSIGDKAQLTNPFNPSRWVAIPGSIRLADIFDPGAGTTAALRSVKNPQITGEETINGVKVWRVEGDVDAESLQSLASIAEPGYTVRGTAWVGQEKPLVHRIRLDGPLGSKDAPNIVRKIDLSRFDEPVTIEAPAS